MLKCYNCNKELDDSTKTREHIPAKALFDGSSEEQMRNLIVVPSCYDCNNNYSRCDEQFRNLIGIANNGKARSKISEKAAKSLTRHLHASLPRLAFSPEGKVAMVEFDSDEILSQHKKNFKGLFYKEYGYPLTENFQIVVITHHNWTEPLPEGTYNLFSIWAMVSPNRVTLINNSLLSGG